MEDLMKIYTDGSCSRKGDGGHSFVVDSEGEVCFYHYASSLRTTNNREELKAVIAALKLADQDDTIITDSMYVINGIRGIRKKNLDLWEEFDSVFDGHRIAWVRGHDGCYWNEVADILAKSGIVWDFRKKV